MLYSLGNPQKENDMKEFLKKLFGFKRLPWQEVLATTVGIFGGIGVIALITYLADEPFLIAPFGASAVLLYSATSSPLAQPRNLIGGHLIASLTGITCYQLMGETWYSITISVTVAILLMMATQTTHPPGGATAIVSVLSHKGYLFVLYPVLAGAVILLISAVLAAKISPYRTYPFRAEKVTDEKKEDPKKLDS